MHVGETRKSSHNHLCQFLKTTSIGVILETVDSENCEAFYEFYLHDFVRSVHKCKYRNPEHDKKEYQVHYYDHIIGY